LKVCLYLWALMTTYKFSLTAYWSWYISCRMSWANLKKKQKTSKRGEMEEQTRSLLKKLHLIYSSFDNFLRTWSPCEASYCKNAQIMWHNISSCKWYKKQNYSKWLIYTVHIIKHNTWSIVKIMHNLRLCTIDWNSLKMVYKGLVPLLQHQLHLHCYHDSVSPFVTCKNNEITINIYM